MAAATSPTEPIERISSNSLNIADDRRGFGWPLIALVIAAGIWGGGGAAYGFNNLVVQIAALIALAFGRTAFFAFWREAPLPARVLILASLMLPAMQLIPLPPALWQALPSGEIAAQSRAAASAGNDWFPASLDPGRSWTALLSMIVPLTLVSIGWSVSDQQIKRLCWAIVAVGILSFAVGIAQVLSQGQSGLLYPENPMPGVLFGTFANRNSAGLFLGIAMVILTGLPMDWRAKPVLAVKLTLFAVLLFAVLLTRSRSAIVLSLIPCAIMGWRVAAQFWQNTPKKSAIVGASIIGALFASLMATQIPGSRLETSLDRFSQSEDPRAQIWDDAQFSAAKYWPIGAGMGTFDEVFQADQSLENISAKKAGRAHNDILELAIEAGAFGITILAAWIAYSAYLAFAARKAVQPWFAWGGAAGLAMIAAQSVTDYPLRNLTMLCTAAVLFLMLLRFSRADDGEPI